MIEKDIFGVLAARRMNERAFNSADCEFLRQLGEHVALASHQVQLPGSLETAYDDLKQTQQAVMQQERLQGARDRWPAASPMTSTTPSRRYRSIPSRCWNGRPIFSAQVRGYLETVDRVVKDVSATVGRMRDFYRRNDADSELKALNLNELIPQVVELTRARWNDMPQQRGIVIRVADAVGEWPSLVLGNASANCAKRSPI